MLAFNVSAKQFFQAQFVAQVLAAIRQHGIDPQLLNLELTESLLALEIEDSAGIINTLGSIGIQFSLDDFGTGHSCLQSIKRLPLNQLKIDLSFIREIANDKGGRAIVRAIIGMAQGLKLNVIAEGVETEVQRDFLLKNGCAHYQGHLFGKPMPIAEFEALLDIG